MSKEQGCGSGYDCQSGKCKTSFNIVILIRIALAAGLFLAGLFLKISDSMIFILYLASFLIAGFDIFAEGINTLIRKRVLDENFLMTIAGVGAFIIKEFPEGAAVMLLYQIGEFFQGRALDKSRDSIAALVDLRPDKITIIENNQLKEIPAESAKPGMSMVIKPGERVALDCVVTEGVSSMDTSALTGESLPRSVGVGDSVLAGLINTGAILYARVEKPLEESAVSRILKLVEDAKQTKAKPEKLITRFARVYTPIVIVLAVLVAFLPALIFSQALDIWVHRALILLVISCPCALVISLPLTYFAGIGGASRRGILFKSTSAMDYMANVGTVVFDKTGTLTTGKFKIKQINANGIKPEALLLLASYAEAFSEHPLAVAIKEAFGKEVDVNRISASRESRGKGVTTEIGDIKVHAGNYDFMYENGVDVGEITDDDTTVFVAVGDRFAGYITLVDTIKEDAPETIRELKKSGIRKIAMLTGDRRTVALSMAQSLGISEVFAECLPEDKMDRLKDIIRHTALKGRRTAFVGDGINDAPVIKEADIGIAMGSLGSDAAIEAADVVIMDDKPSRLLDALKGAKKTKRIIIQNIVMGIVIKLFIMVLGVIGIATMWFAVFADVGVAILAIINATRAMYIRQRD